MNIQRNLPLYYEKYPVMNLARRNYANNLDLEYINTLYPNELAELKYIIEQECDKLDYNGSMIYDECPDKIMFIKKCNEICAIANCNCKYAKKCTDKAQLRDVINILFTNEIFKRRCNRRNYFY